MLNNLEKGGVFVVDSLWGDNGKGNFVLYLSYLLKALMGVDAGNGSNKEHGIFVNGKYIKTNQFPLCVLNPELEICFGSGVTINPDLFFKEVKRLGIDLSRVKVDPRSPIVTKEDIDWEYNTLRTKIGSTYSGIGKCRSRWILRESEIAWNWEDLKPFLKDTVKEINDACKKGIVVFEGAQGTMLSLSIGIRPDGSPEYPNVTSTNVTTVGMADKAGLNYQHIKEVIMLVKALPTREGKGSMGGGRELPLDEIISRNLKEDSSIGGVPRRKAEITEELVDMLAYSSEVNGATMGALTFCDHLDPDIANVKTYKELSKSLKVMHLAKKLERKLNIPFTLFNTGKEYDCIINLENPSFPLYANMENYN